MDAKRYQVVVIGGGHAGAEAAWAAANLLGETASVALVTLDPAKIGVMSCNPAIGGLAKGQLVREIDALNGLMSLAADASGINFKVLNTSKGPAVRGPRCQCDKHAYAAAVQALIGARPEIEIVRGAVETVRTENGRITGLGVRTPGGDLRIDSTAVVLTTGTFMRGLMHTGEDKTPGGRHGEAPTSGISKTLSDLGFELGRLKTGTPPRISKSSIDWDAMEPELGDAEPTPFSDLSPAGWSVGGLTLDRFPLIEQSECRRTSTTPGAHKVIRANLHRAPMFSGQLESAGPRYCPSIEDKVVRFADRDSHGVILEPEGLGSDWIYCNGIATSLPTDVQDRVVRAMPGCERADVLLHGYAVEYDMVRPHQIQATGQTKLVEGLYLAGQINGTSGYEEAAAQGLIAGVNAALRALNGGLGGSEFVLGRDEAYAGVLMDDLVTKTPVEPYRMFTSRAEHRLLLRADNAPERLTARADGLGLLDNRIGRVRRDWFAARAEQVERLNGAIDRTRVRGDPLSLVVRRPGFEPRTLGDAVDLSRIEPATVTTVVADRRYEAYVVRQRAEIRRQRRLERRNLPVDMDYQMVSGLRNEARQALSRFRPATFGQAGRLEGVTPADLTLLSVAMKKYGRRAAEAGADA